MDRRTFIQRATAMGAAGLVVPASLSRWITRPARARAIGRRTLVLVNMGGGNDGLNTVVPIAQPAYRHLRPNLAIPTESTLALDSDNALHPALTGIHQLYERGQLAMIHGLSYPQPNLSHFRATDIWFSGSSADQHLSTGWLARYLEAIHPEFPATLPTAPLAVQQATAHSIPLRGERGTAGVVVADPGTFLNLVGSTYSGPWQNEVPPTQGGDALSYIRQVDVDSFEYAQAIGAAADAGTNASAYPATRLGAQLEVVARLISGELDTPLYITAMSGFDTHVQQPQRHTDLLQELGDAVAAFFADLHTQGLDDDVLLVTTSEFGRRQFENGGLGTDHGTAGVQFAIGPTVAGGVYGQAPDLEDLDPATGNLRQQHDYRQLYASLLRGHFDASEALTADVLHDVFETIPFLAALVGVGAAAPAPPRTTRIRRVQPNPTSRSRAVVVELDVARAGHTRVGLYSVTGHRVRDVKRGHLPAGRHQLTLTTQNLAAGTYFVRLEGTADAAKLIVLP